MLITGMFAGIFGLMYLVLTAQIIRARQAERVSIGDGGNAILALRVRAHGNFVEYVPFALLMMLMLEIQNAHDVVLYGIGGILVLGRIAHAIALTHKILWLRVYGMFMTMAVLAVSSILLILQYFSIGGL